MSEEKDADRWTTARVAGDVGGGGLVGGCGDAAGALKLPKARWLVPAAAAAPSERAIAAVTVAMSGAGAPLAATLLWRISSRAMMAAEGLRNGCGEARGTVWSSWGRSRSTAPASSSESIPHTAPSWLNCAVT